MKRPPIEKIYEAWTALTDNRLEIYPESDFNSGKALVKSSDGTKEYTVSWRDNGSIFTSTDNATFWQGYPGYPVIAVMMKIGLLPYDAPTAELYSGINWTKLNAEHKRDYAAALADIQQQRDIDPAKSRTEAEKALDKLIESDIQIKRK